jgi:hypothetical protein
MGKALLFATLRNLTWIRVPIIKDLSPYQAFEIVASKMDPHNDIAIEDSVDYLRVSSTTHDYAMAKPARSKVGA